MSDIVKVYQSTAYEVNWKALAAGVEKLVMAKLKKDLEHWHDDIGMKSMFLQDAADGLRVCEALEEGKNWPTIENMLWKMDTAARDYVYEFIAEVAGEDFFDIVRV